MLPFLTPGADPSLGARYRLVSVVNHSGAVGGGHYISYGLHQPSGRWFEHDDSTITHVAKEAVEAAQGYVLMYERIADDAVVAARDDCLSPLAPPTLSAESTAAAAATGGTSVLISRKWLALFGTCSNPGPLCNLDFACRHGGVLPHCVADLRNLAVWIPLEMWTKLHDRFGGGEAPILFDKPCVECCQVHFNLIDRRAKELKVMGTLSTSRATAQSKGPKHALAIVWIEQWQAFTDGKTLYDRPPGPIDNRRLRKRVRDGLKLRPEIDLEMVTDEVWTVLKSWYGELDAKDDISVDAPPTKDGGGVGVGSDGGGQALRVTSDPGPQGRRRSPRQAAAAAAAANKAAGLPEKTRSVDA